MSLKSDWRKSRDVFERETNLMTIPTNQSQPAFKEVCLASNLAILLKMVASYFTMTVRGRYMGLMEAMFYKHF